MPDDVILSESEKLKKLSQLSPKEQEIIDLLASTMVDKYFEDLALGTHRKPVTHRK